MEAYNFLKFLEDKKGKQIPFMWKLLHAPETLTKEDLHIKGNLYLDRIPLKRLPDNLTVNGYLSIERTNINKLPTNLTINGSFYVDDTPISSIPEGLKVRRSFSARRVRFFKGMSEDEIKKMVEEKGGYIKGEIRR